MPAPYDSIHREAAAVVIQAMRQQINFFFISYTIFRRPGKARPAICLAEKNIVVPEFQGICPHFFSIRYLLLTTGSKKKLYHRSYTKI